MLAGCGTGSDKVSTGYYKNVAIKPNGEFVIKDRVDDSKAKKGGIFYYVEMGKDDATKDKIVSVTAKAGNAPIDIHWKSTVGNMTALRQHGSSLTIARMGILKKSMNVLPARQV